MAHRTVECPNEVYVLAGWSQGAQVIGEGLFLLNQSVQSRVAYVAMFGDPTFSAGNVGFPFTNICFADRQPWVQGTSECWSNGVFSSPPRIPYLPAGFETRTGSWCRDGDGSCTGVQTDILFSTLGDTGQHMHYFDPDGDSAMAMRDAAASLKTFIPANANQLDDSFLEFATGDAGADFAFVFDTTGSMSGSIANMKSQATALAHLWLTNSTNGRVALVEFKDQGDPFVSRVDLGFTSDESAFQNAVNGLAASGGGDTPEAQLSGLMTALDGLSWQQGATKVALVITDAPGKDPEPITGFTRSQVSQHALQIDPVALYGVDVLGDSSVTGFMQPLADATAGRVYVLGSGQSLSDLLANVITSVAMSPVAALGGPYFAVTGTPVHFNANRSFDPDADLVSYKWDFDGNGSIDQTTTIPTLDHTYPGAYTGLASVRIVSADGGEAIATTQVTVDAAGFTDDSPITPTAATATITGTGQATISWTPAANDRANGYTVALAGSRLMRSAVIGSGNSLVVNGLDLSQPVTFEVRAQNDFGASTPKVSNAVGGSSAWAPGVVVSNDPAVDGIHALMPAVGLSVNNTGLALWARYHTGTDYDIYAARRDPTSGAWDAPIRANDVTTGAQYYPAVAFDSSNNAYAVWVDERNARRDIYFSKRSSSTGLWSANVRVNSDTTFSDQTTPSIAVSPTGEAISVWYRKVGTNKYYIYSARLPAGATTWSASFKVTPSQSPDRAAPDVTIGPDGTAYATWVEPRSGNADIWFATLPSGSTTWSTASKISDDPGTTFQGDPEIGMDGSGNLVVAWDDWRTNPHQVRVRRRPAGGAWAPSVVVSTNGSNGPSLSVGSAGRAFVAWQDGSYPPTGNTHVWGSMFDPVAGSWSTAERLDDGGTNDSASQPATAIAGTKTILIWQNATGLQGGGHDNQVWARWRN